MQATASEAESKGEVVAAFVGAALLFGAGIWNVLGAEKAQEFFAGYLLEQSLSVDNLFVFILVFRYFRAPKADQDKVCVSCVCTLTPQIFEHAVPGRKLPAFAQLHSSDYCILFLCIAVWKLQMLLLA